MAQRLENEMSNGITDAGEALSILEGVEETLRALACVAGITEGQSFAMLNLANTMDSALTYLKGAEGRR